MTTDPEFFVAVDSDGCAFDTMEVKHKECFIPAHRRSISAWPARAGSAREVAEFVNLRYSRSTGGSTASPAWS